MQNKTPAPFHAEFSIGPTVRGAATIFVRVTGRMLGIALCLLVYCILIDLMGVPGKGVSTFDLLVSMPSLLCAVSWLWLFVDYLNVRRALWFVTSSSIIVVDKGQRLIELHRSKIRRIPNRRGIVWLKSIDQEDKLWTIRYLNGSDWSMIDAILKAWEKAPRDLGK